MNLCGYKYPHDNSVKRKMGDRNKSFSENYMSGKSMLVVLSLGHLPWCFNIAGTHLYYHNDEIAIVIIANVTWLLRGLKVKVYICEVALASERT